MDEASGSGLRDKRIAELERQVAAGLDGAEAAFWEEVAAVGTPLVEPIEGDDRHVLVTFVWRGDADTENVMVVSPWQADTPTDNVMERVPDTDVFFRTYRARSNVRGAYQFSVNDPLRPWTELALEEQDAYFGSFVPDPLNPAVLHWPPQPPQPEEIASVVSLPDAPPQPWSDERTEVPRGTVEHCRYRSERLADERDLWVYLPPAPPEGLLVVFDGRSYTTVIPTPTILDNLLAAGHIPPLAAVLLQSPGDSEVEQRKARTWELSCNPDFADFLADELLPWVRQNFGVPTPQELTLTAGSSLGGLAAVYAAYRRPEVFGRALSLSGSFWWKPESGTDTAMATEEDEEWEWLTRQLVAAERLPVRFYVNVGILETDAPAGMPSQVIANRHLRDVLLARGHQVHYAEYAGQHDYACWRGTLADGLIALFA